jgi:hypothetical protein
MSNRQRGMSDVTFESVSEQQPASGDQGLIFFGVIYPALVIVLELLSRMCAGSCGRMIASCK